MKILYVTLVGIFIGWVANLIQIFSTMPATFGEMTPFYVAKIIGVVFVPIGSVLGWVGFF